jgi:hypothetical protein
VEDEQKDLGKEPGNQDAKDNFDGHQEVVVERTDSVVKRQTRYAAKKESRCVDDMRDEIQHLRLKDRGDI